jgi:hypothetical protein
MCSYVPLGLSVTPCRSFSPSPEILPPVPPSAGPCPPSLGGRNMGLESSHPETEGHQPHFPSLSPTLPGGRCHLLMMAALSVSFRKRNFLSFSFSSGSTSHTTRESDCQKDQEGLSWPGPRLCPLPQPQFLHPGVRTSVTQAHLRPL